MYVPSNNSAPPANLPVFLPMLAPFLALSDSLGK
jgi:hypothetical protein